MIKNHIAQTVRGTIFILGIAGFYTMFSTNKTPKGKPSTGVFNLKQLNQICDLPEDLQYSPICKMAAFHNGLIPLEDYDDAELVIGTCMDRRINLKIPDRFAFIIRKAGANMNGSEFPISFALSMGIKQVAIIGHTDCGMKDLSGKKDAVIKGYMNQFGWDKDIAENYFTKNMPRYEITDEIAFTQQEVARLRKRFPNITIVGLIYNVENHKLYMIEEKIAEKS